MVCFSVNDTRYCVDCNDAVLEKIVRQLNIFSFGFSAERVDLVVNNERVCAVENGKGLPLFYLGDGSSVEEEFKRFGRFFGCEFLKSLNFKDFNAFEFVVDRIVVEKEGWDGCLSVLTSLERTDKVYASLFDYFLDKNCFKGLKYLVELEVLINHNEGLFNSEELRLFDFYSSALFRLFNKIERKPEIRVYSDNEIVVKNKDFDYVFTVNVFNELFNSGENYCKGKDVDFFGEKSLVLPFYDVPVFVR